MRACVRVRARAGGRVNAWVCMRAGVRVHARVRARVRGDARSRQDVRAHFMTKYKNIKTPIKVRMNTIHFVHTKINPLDIWSRFYESSQQRYANVATVT